MPHSIAHCREPCTSEQKQEPHPNSQSPEQHVLAAPSANAPEPNSVLAGNRQGSTTCINACNVCSSIAQALSLQLLLLLPLLLL
jgi:hypothetical protein